MARGAQPVAAVAAAAFAGSAAVILQWILEDRGSNRPALYQNLVSGTQMLVLLVLLLTAPLERNPKIGRTADVVALGAVAAVRVTHIAVETPKAAAPAGAGLVMLEAIVLALAYRLSK